MKRTMLPACVALVLAALIAVGSQSFLGPCVHEDGSFGVCHWAGQALLGEGCALAAMALLAACLRDCGVRLGLYLAMLPTAIVGLLTPGTLIDICKMSTMRCRMLMRPAMLVLFAMTLVAALAGCLAVRGDKA